MPELCDPTCCQDGRKRPYAAVLTGSTCARSAANERRRRIFNTSASHHWSPRALSAGVGELAADQPAVDGHPAQHVAGHPQPEAEAGRGVVGSERAVRAGIPAEQLAERVVDRFGERRGHSDGHRHPDPVTQYADVLDCDPPGLARERDGQRAFGGLQAVQPAAHFVCVVQRSAISCLGQRAQHAQQIRDALGVAGQPLGAEVLQLLRGGGDDLWIEQLPQLDTAQQLGQQHAVQRQCRGTPLGQRAVALVHERADVAEQQRRRERRRGRGLHLDHPQPALRHAVHQLGERGHVIDVLQAFADRLQHDGEVGVLAGDVQQLCCALPLMPQRRPLAGMPARQKQCAGRAFAEPRGEQRRTAHLRGDDRFDLVGVEHEHVGPGAASSVSGSRTMMPSSEAVGFSSIP